VNLQGGCSSLTLGVCHTDQVAEAIMIKLKGIGHVNLRVADQQASKRF
jgi:hypothetical protein